MMEYLELLALALMPTELINADRRAEIIREKAAEIATKKD